MTDSDRQSDRYGEPLPNPAASPLIYRPPELDSDGQGDDSDLPTGDDRVPPPSDRAWAPIVVTGLIVVLLAAVAGVLFTGGSSAEAENVVVPPSLTEGTLRGSIRIQPLPSGDVEGPVRSSMTLGVRVTRPSGTPVSDTTVSFQVESGEGTLSEFVAETDEDGVAETAFNLPERPGSSVITAFLDEARFNVGRIIVTAMPGFASTIQAVSGNGQQALVGDLLPNRLYVAIRDAEGNPVPHAEVRFQADEGNGIVAPTQTRTDSLGRASTMWRLGMQDGPQTLQVVSPDVMSSVVTFSATGNPRATLDTPDNAPVETRSVRVAPIRFAIGGSHLCKLEGGTVRCRGDSNRGRVSANGTSGLLSLTSGASHSCGLDAAGVASCWGANESGQLGDGSRTDRQGPTNVRTELRFSALAAGTSHTCGLAGGGVPLCWGRNLSGQLGDGTRNDQTAPRTVGSGMRFVAIAAGWSHTCGLTESGNAFCWGLNSKGQLGDGGRLDRLEPTLVGGSVETIVAGAEHTCGVSRGTVRCWGGNANGQLGDGSGEDRTSPVDVTGLPGRPSRLAAGAVHTCALMAGGQAYCWGQNISGQLGDGSNQARTSPVAVSGGITFAEIYAGGAQTCGRTAAGEEFCWGLNAAGQLGDGSRTNRNVPTRVN